MDQIDAGVECGLDVLLDNASQPTHRRVGRRRDVTDRRELRVGVHWEARLDRVDARAIQRGGYLAFVVVGERSTGRLFTVSQGGVEDPSFGELGISFQRALGELDPPGLPTCPRCRETLYPTLQGTGC